MKHLKQLLLLLCVMASSMCGNLSAQTFTASPAPVDGKFVAGTKWYTIYQIRGNGTGYLSTAYVNTDNYLLLNNSTAPTSDEGYWCVVENENGNYEFYNRASGAMKVLGIYYPRNEINLNNSGRDAYAKMYDVGTSATNVYTAFAKGTST